MWGVSAAHRLARQCSSWRSWGSRWGSSFGGCLQFDGVASGLDASVAPGGMGVALGVFYAYCRRVDATWGWGLEAERQVGDLIEHAVAQRGCAFAHDVKEALGGRGNVDHVVMTPVGVWVVETKAAWLSKRRFRSRASPGGGERGPGAVPS